MSLNMGKIQSSGMGLFADTVAVLLLLITEWLEQAFSTSVPQMVSVHL
jgi:hypothetical protein